MRQGTPPERALWPAKGFRSAKSSASRLSLPSLRVDAFTVGIAAQIQRARRTGLTFAPEAGTWRMRQVINKLIREEDLYAAVDSAYSQGWRRMKLYFLTGLPTETDEDTRGIAELGRNVVLWLPFAVIALLILALAGAFSWVTARASRVALRRRIQSPLLREVTARLLGAVVLILGAYLVLRVSGLSRLALTVLGGTGLLGLVIGIAFRDITENFLASIFLSAQRPFRAGDLVQIVDCLGYVQRLTVRTFTRK